MANNITQLVQRAALAYAQSVGITTVPVSQIYKGLDDQALRLPRAVFQCQRATRMITSISSSGMGQAFDGMWEAELRVIVRSQGDDSNEEEHHNRATEIFDAFLTETITADLSDALTEEDFTATMVTPVEQSWDIDGDVEGRRSWRSELVLNVRCCGAAIGN